MSPEISFLDIIVEESHGRFPSGFGISLTALQPSSHDQIPHPPSQHVRKAHSIRNEKSWNRHFILVLLAGTRRNPFRQEPSIIISSNPF